MIKTRFLTFKFIINCLQVAYEDTPIIDALHKFVYKRVSALPIVDSEVGIYNNLFPSWAQRWALKIMFSHCGHRGGH
jgi:CBS domain-containing protein